MSTATKTKPKLDAEQFVNQMAEEQTRLFEAAEIICGEIADGQTPMGNELLIFERLKWDGNKIAREVERMRVVRGLQKNAASIGQMNAAKADAVKIREANSVKISDAEKQIEAAQTARDVAFREIVDGELKVENFEAVRARLRTLAPAWANNERTAKARESSQLFGRVGPVSSRINMIEKIIADLVERSDPDSRLAHLQHVDHPLGRAALSKSLDGQMIRFHIDEGKWLEYVQALRDELPGLLAEQETLKNQKAAFDSHADEILDCYLPND